MITATPIIDPIVVRLTELRNEEGWSQGQVAEMLGLAQSSLSRYENGGVNMPWHVREMYAALVGHTVELVPIS